MIEWTKVVQPNYWFVAPELIVMLTMLIIMIADFYTKEKRALVWATVGGLALAAISVWYSAVGVPDIAEALAKGTPKEFFGGMLVADQFTFFMKAVLLMVAALVTMLSMDYVARFLKGMHLEFYEVLLSATLGMMIMVSSRDLVAIYVGLELNSICSYVLAGLLRKDPKSNEAALKYFLNGALASAVLLFGVSLLYGATGTTHLAEMAQQLATKALDPGFLSFLVTGVLFVAGGFAFKVAAVPMHLWAPDAYEGAPTPVTGFFSVGPKGAGFAALLRVFVVGLGVAPLAERWSMVWAILATASMFYGNITALLQTNIKRMMAYSSIAQAGYILVGVVAAGSLTTDKGVSSVLYYILAYALTNLGIFAILTHLDQEGGWVNVEDFKGLVKRNPFYAWTLLACFASLIGIPPFVGFFGKFFLFNAALTANYLWLALVMAVNSVISVGYYYGVVKAMFLDESDKGALTPSTGVMATVVLSLAGVVLVGLVSSYIIPITDAAALLR